MAEAETTTVIDNHDTSEHDITDSEAELTPEKETGEDSQFNETWKEADASYEAAIRDAQEEAARVDAMLRGEGAEEAPEPEPDEGEEPDHIPVPPIPSETVYAWPLHGLFVVELEYADLGDMGRSLGGNMRVGKVVGTEEDPKLIQLRDMFVIFVTDHAASWMYRNRWHHFWHSDIDIMAVITTKDVDPRIAVLQAIQQADHAREALFNNTQFQTEGRLPVPTRDYSDWP